MAFFGGNSGGVNVDIIAKQLIQIIHREEPIEICYFSGYQDMPDGSVVRRYAEPYPTTAQIQELPAAEVRKVDLINDNSRRLVFYIDAHLSSMDRKTEDGGPVILARDRVWYVTSFINSFNRVDWVAVVGTLVMDDISQYRPEEPPP